MAKNKRKQPRKSKIDEWKSEQRKQYGARWFVATGREPWNTDSFWWRINYRCSREEMLKAVAELKKLTTPKPKHPRKTKERTDHR